ARRPLATALAAVRARRSLAELDGWLPAAATAHLRSGAEQARRFARYPGAVERAAELGDVFAFDLALVAPNLPDYPVPRGHTEMTWLRHLTEEGAIRRYGPRRHELVPGAYKQIDHELALIDALGFPGYFLIVWDIVEFCRLHDIFCQGRGSAANSAVCYALGITNADAVKLGLLFERFLSPERDGPPDIDVDIESDRREEVIQYVYEKHGRRNAAQVANVITYRARSAVRDMGKALGHTQGQVDAWSKQLDHYVLDLVRDHHGVEYTLATIPPEEPAVYEMLCEADSIGVFQVESRAQMATLPRLKPRCFNDLVVEVALIRPGPIQGGSVHPYIRRRKGTEEVTFLHPLLERSLAKTLGVPLFQEQLMQMAIDVAGFSGAEADQLRQAMGSKRSAARMEALRARFYAGMEERGITGEVADAIYDKLAAFANFGFPESHSVSF